MKRDVEKLEMRLLLEAVEQMYGYDFRDYAEASIKRRLTYWLAESEFGTFSLAQSRLLRDRGVFDSLLRAITINVTEMFRDPGFFRMVRAQVVPFLKTYPFVKIWHAGCATGEEAYSMAILLNEEGMAGRYRIYATDIDESIIARAQEGILAVADMQLYTRNYQLSGGRAAFADYYTARYDYAALSPALRKDIVFAPHNLATDSEFGEMNMILCRNVMIYFKPALKERCLRLFDASLPAGGFLGLGQKEALESGSLKQRFEELDGRMRIFRKRYS